VSNFRHSYHLKRIITGVTIIVIRLLIFSHYILKRNVTKKEAPCASALSSSFCYRVLGNKRLSQNARSHHRRRLAYSTVPSIALMESHTAFSCRGARLVRLRAVGSHFVECFDRTNQLAKPG
jgi:hypothetical protein